MRIKDADKIRTYNNIVTRKVCSRQIKVHTFCQKLIVGTATSIANNTHYIFANPNLLRLRLNFNMLCLLLLTAVKLK
jgi:hypothetical protein